jgi:hypothetical protein
MVRSMRDLQILSTTIRSAENSNHDIESEIQCHGLKLIEGLREGELEQQPLAPCRNRVRDMTPDSTRETYSRSRLLYTEGRAPLSQSLRPVKLPEERERGEPAEGRRLSK